VDTKSQKAVIMAEERAQRCVEVTCLAIDHDRAGNCVNILRKQDGVFYDSVHSSGSRASAWIEISAEAKESREVCLNLFLALERHCRVVFFTWPEMVFGQEE